MKDYELVGEHKLSRNFMPGDTVYVTVTDKDGETGRSEFIPEAPIDCYETWKGEEGIILKFKYNFLYSRKP